MLCIDFDELSRYYTDSNKFVGLLAFVQYSRFQFLDANCDLFAILHLFPILDLFARTSSQDFTIAFTGLDLLAIALSNSYLLTIINLLCDP